MPGTPSVATVPAAIRWAASRIWSISGRIMLGMPPETVSQNFLSWLRRRCGGLPAMIAALTAPIEMPAIQLTSTPSSSSR